MKIHQIPKKLEYSTFLGKKKQQYKPTNEVLRHAFSASFFVVGHIWNLIIFFCFFLWVLVGVNALSLAV